MSRKKRITLGLLIPLSLLLALFLFLELGMLISHTWRPYTPDYPKEDLTPLLEKATLDVEDYDLLFRQTGLTKIAIDELREASLAGRIHAAQEDFFYEPTLESIEFFPYICMEERDDIPARCILKNGDILISSSTHIGPIRIGHAAVVVDAERGLILEAVGYNSPATYDSVTSFFVRGSVMVLRPKGGDELGEAVAQYAKEELAGTPYSILAGLFGDKGSTKSTHCGHLIYLAYEPFGIDVDTGGGRMVTPHDVVACEAFDLIQIYGFDPDVLW